MNLNTEEKKQQSRNVIPIDSNLYEFQRKKGQYLYTQGGDGNFSVREPFLCVQRF